MPDRVMFDWSAFLIGALCATILLLGCIAAYLVNEDLKKNN